MKPEYIKEHTIVLMLAGSHAYGTNIEDSDIDIRGIAVIPKPEEYAGFLDKFKQYSESSPEDLTIFGIQKAFELMSKCNPNMLELLFTEEKFYRKHTSYWNLVLKHRNRFLSKRARHTYTGYAYSQLNRIKVARDWLLNPPKAQPNRSDFKLPTYSLIQKSDLGAYQWIMVNLLKESLKYLDFSEETKQEILSSNLIGVVQSRGIPDDAYDAVQKVTGASDEWMEMMKREQAYATAKRNWESYLKWKEGRNKKRAALEEKFGYDTKHASHLVRLCRMGQEILSTQKVNVYRPDAKELLEIRNGSWSYEKVSKYAEEMQEKIKMSASKSALPESADIQFLNQLCAEVINTYIKDTNT